MIIQDQPLPQASALPSISGAAVRTVTLTATAGVWTNSPSATAYQWLRCNPDRTGCQSIPGATAASYTLALADEGHAVTVRVTATNTSGSATATARATGAVSPAPPSVIHAPAVTGAAYQQDVSLSVVPNSAVWQDTPDTTYTTTWKRCDADGTNCQPIGGANASQYTPSRTDVGHALVLAVTATNPDGSATATSTPTQVIVPAPPRWRVLPLLSTDPGRVGDVLSMTPGVWSGTPVTSDVVQMMRCTNACSAVGPANATSYTLTSEDLGAILRVREYASNVGGYTVIWSARFVGPVSSAASGSAVVADNAAAQVRNTQGVVLALASIQTNVRTNVASVRTAAARHTRSDARVAPGTSRRRPAPRVGVPGRDAPGWCTGGVHREGEDRRADHLGAARVDDRPDPGRRRPPAPLSRRSAAVERSRQPPGDDRTLEPVEHDLAAVPWADATARPSPPGRSCR